MVAVKHWTVMSVRRYSGVTRKMTKGRNYVLGKEGLLLSRSHRGVTPSGVVEGREI